MELTRDLVAIQGILMSVIKTTGEFTRINHRGGNEQKISATMMKIQKYLTQKCYIKNGSVNDVFDKQVEDVVFFLALNTKYNTPLELADYCHLINIMPQLSKCLLMNVVYGLDLCKYYCTAIEKLPLANSVELLEETIPCLKKSTPKVHLMYVFMFLKATANKLNDCGENADENVEKISDVANIILQGLTGLYSDQTQNWKAVQIYQHMGYTLFALFDLLLYCTKLSANLTKFVEYVVKTCISLNKNVTVTVYCSWAEIDKDDQPLQSIISEKAYLVIEAYQKCKEAKELVGMLGTIARKPKTLAERVQQADTSVIVKNVYKNDADQRTWFQALLGTQILQSEDAMRCVSTWAHLCDEHDVTRLLNMSVKNAGARRLAVQCAATLSLEKLVVVCTRFFFVNKFKNVLNEDREASTQLTLIFNKLGGQANAEGDFIKELTLLLLQNPTLTLTFVCNECIKNSFYTECLQDFFFNSIEVFTIDDFCLGVVTNCVLNAWDNFRNISNYAALIKTLVNVGCVSSAKILRKVLLPVLRQLYAERCFEDLNYFLQIFLASAVKVPVTEDNACVVKILLDIMSDCRCKFLEFDNVKHQNAKWVVDIITSLCEVNDFKVEAKAGADDFTMYYQKYLSEANSSFLRSFYHDFDVRNHAASVTHLIQVLQRSVTNEWLWVCEELSNDYGVEKTMLLLSDVLILLCELGNTQYGDKGTKVTFALKYYLQQFGLAMQKMQLNSTLDNEVFVTKNVCRLLRHLPDTLREAEGLSLTNILTERSLKSLVSDKEFVCLLVSINNKAVCKTLAQRMI